MNIRKIIREELDWVKNVPSSIPKKNYTVDFEGYDVTEDELWEKLVKLMLMVEATYGYDNVFPDVFKSNNIVDSIKSHTKNWDPDFENSIQIYITPRVDDEKLRYGYPKNYEVDIGWDNNGVGRNNSSYTHINIDEFLGGKLNESQDFDWIKDEKVKPVIKKGMKIKFNPPSEKYAVIKATIKEVVGDDVILIATEPDALKGFEMLMKKSEVQELIDTGYYQVDINESQDFDWIKETPPYTLGDFLEDYEVCFNDSTCDINIKEDEITFNVDFDEWLESIDIHEEESWYLGPFIEYGSNYVDDSDYYEFDSDEMNYSSHIFSDEQKNRLQKVLDVISPDNDLENHMSRDELNDIVEDLRYQPLVNQWWDLVSDVLGVMGTHIQRNRWSELGNDYDRILENQMPGISLEKDGDNVEITVPFKYLREMGTTNLSKLLYKATSPLSEPWSDWFYEHWDTSGGEGDIEWYVDRFLDRLEEFISDEGFLEPYLELEKIVKPLGFKPSNNRFMRDYVKKNEDGTAWFLKPNFEDKKVELSLHNSMWSYVSKEKYVIPYNEIGTYLNNYRLDLDSTENS